MTSTVSILIGSVRNGRQGHRVASYLSAKFQLKGIKTHIIDPAELQLPMLENRFDNLPEDKKTPSLKDLKSKFVESDAFVIVSPEYNHTFSPVVSNTLDYFFHNEYYYKVAGIATYSIGGFGGIRAAGPLHPLLNGLGLVTIPRELPVPTVQNVLHEDGTLLPNAGHSGELLDNGANAFVQELDWFSSALKAARTAGTPN